jgi:16S rRNA G966 N2-methylase RsmD
MNNNIIEKNKKIINKYKKMEYPYYFYAYKFNKKEYMNEFNKYKPIIYRQIPSELSKYKLSKYNNSYFIIKSNYLQESFINDLSDYFTEKVRVKCQLLNFLTPLEYWKKNKDEIIKISLQKYNEITILTLSEIIYKNSKLCNNFRITVSSAVLQYFKPKSWLDISAGWGDRLISAIINKVDLYVSSDPNLELQPCYKNIINKLVPKTKRKNYIIHPTGFLEAPITQNNFDLLFSSPPFFDLEKYSTFTQDSFTQFKTQKSWTDNFFMKSLVKSYNLLKLNGFMVLYIGNFDNYMVEQLKKLDKIMKYHGIIYFYETKPRGMYVWEKINSKKIISF